MTKILATVKKPGTGGACINISTRAIVGQITFVQPDPPMLSALKDGQKVTITEKPLKT